MMFFLNEAYKLHMVVVISNQFSWQICSLMCKYPKSLFLVLMARKAIPKTKRIPSPIPQDCEGDLCKWNYDCLAKQDNNQLFFFSVVSLIVFYFFESFGSPNRPASNVEDRTHDTVKADASGPVKLDAAAQAHVEKHRYLLTLKSNCS